MSFSIDLTGMFDYASQMFTALSPIVIVIGGLSLGVSLVYFVIKMVRKINLG